MPNKIAGYPHTKRHGWKYSYCTSFIIANSGNNANVHKQNEYMYHRIYSMKYYKTIKKELTITMYNNMNDFHIMLEDSYKNTYAIWFN